MAFGGDAPNGEQLFADLGCETCHNDKKNGVFEAGLHAFDVNEFTYPDYVEYSDYRADTVAELSTFIANEMNAGGLCDADCADDIAAYFWSYREDSTMTPGGDNGGDEAPVTVTPIEFDEDGLKLELVCAEGESDFNVKVTNPNGETPAELASYFTPVVSNDDGLKPLDMSSVIKLAQDDVLVLEGQGIDIWDTTLHFHGLSTEVFNGQLDMTLTVEDVVNVQHDFAKVGILASSTNDLTGDLIFLHWSGAAGIAEDSGVGALDQYELLVENPVEGTKTPTPTTLRITYEDGQLRTGGCYACDAPAMQDAAEINFVPKSAFIVVSSHDLTAIEAKVRVHDAHAPKTDSETVFESVISCEDAASGIQLSDLELQGIDQLQVEIFQANSLVGQQLLQRTFSGETSCAVQDQLLQPQVRRLSQVQIRNALTDTFGNIFDARIWPEMEDGAKLIGMNTMADKLNVNSLNFERLYKSSRTIVSTLLTEHAEIKACAGSDSDACVTELALEYGPKVWRRPLSDDEIAGLYTGFEAAGSNDEALEFMFNAFILSSNFLFRTELGHEADGFTQLNNYEIASLLSFTVWNSTPDQALLTLAAKASPITEAELKAQVDRMFADPRADGALLEIYKDYLKLDLVLTRNKAEEYGFSDAVRRDLLASAEKMMLDSIQSGGHYLDVFSGDTFYVNETIAKFFNTTSSSSTLEPVELDSTQRSGMLNHPAFLSVHSTLTQSGIVQRGVFALEQLLCKEIPDPPGEVMGLPVPTDVVAAITSERDLLQSTHSLQPACMGCHKFIDPAGFGFENFDAVGRYRETEKEGVVINASGVLEGVGEHVLSYNTSAEYARALTESPQMNRCVSKRFLEHYLSQELSANSCELTKYQSLLGKSDAGVKDLLYALVSLESFGKRKLNP